MEVGDIVIALTEADTPYSITKGREFEGTIIGKRSLGDSSTVGRKGDTIRVKIIKAESENNIGDAYWVNPKYFKLKENGLEMAEDF